MNKRKLLLAVTLALFAASLLLSGGALAVSGPKRVTFEYVRTQTIDHGKIWADQYGLHVRGQVDLGYVSGDINGAATVVYNADLVLFFTPEGFKPAPNSGAAWGTITIDETNQEKVSPAWKGSWSYQVSDGKVTGGEMTAWNAFTRQYLTIDKVSQTASGAILHKGYLQFLPCVDAKCPTAP